MDVSTANLPNASSANRADFGSSRVVLYDTTLRDGAQRKGICFSLEDKLKITRLLDEFGVSFIEGGWPGSNPKDFEYFKSVQSMRLKNATVVAFGSTRRRGVKAEDDFNLRMLLEAGTRAVALVGKSSPLHVKRVLRVSLEENLEMIADSVSFAKRNGREVIFDAEHYFDAFQEDGEYAVKALLAAHNAGADWLVLCDTNGHHIPSRVAEIVKATADALAQASSRPARLGIHAHNDSELAVANSLAAVEAGVAQIQGTINGYGERCGNANLVSLVPTLQVKMGRNCVPQANLSRLTELSRTVSEIANLSPDPHAPYVGSAAFAHKAGLHAAAVERYTESYEHMPPEMVGNSREILISELSGRGNVRLMASQFQVESGVEEGEDGKVLDRIKELEQKGYKFEDAAGSVELMMRRNAPGYKAPFEIVDMNVFVSQFQMGENGERRSEAIVKVRVGDKLSHTVSAGKGPVHALDCALRKALLPAFPEVEKVRLVDYKVRILDPEQATEATTRVVIEAACPSRHDGERSNGATRGYGGANSSGAASTGEGTASSTHGASLAYDDGDMCDGERWSTVGLSDNIIEASCQALAESLELYLLRHACDRVRTVEEVA